MEENEKTKMKKGHECGGCGGCGGHGHGKTPPPVTEVPEPTDWETFAKYKAAELENYIKRTRDSVQNAFNDGRIQVLSNILPLGDTLAEAIKTGEGSGGNAPIQEGLEILMRKFDDTLQRLGVEEIPVKPGDAFDPYIHSCVSAAADSNNKVLEVWQKGYKFAGRVIRPATVKI